MVSLSIPGKGQDKHSNKGAFLHHIRKALLKEEAGYNLHSLVVVDDYIREMAGSGNIQFFMDLNWGLNERSEKTKNESGKNRWKNVEV